MHYLFQKSLIIYTRAEVTDLIAQAIQLIAKMQEYIQYTVLLDVEDKLDAPAFLCFFGQLAQETGS